MGECVCLSGPSGSGKTLLLRSIADLDDHAGTALLDGIPCEHHPPSEWRSQVGFFPSENHWWLDRVGDHFCHVDPSELELLGLESQLLNQVVSRLSTGERQRFALLRLLANEPKALLLDEPTANLDPLSTEHVEQLLHRYRDRTGAALLWVSHDQAQVRRVADRHLRLVNGGIQERTQITP